MSTEKQRYSIENQAAVIATYAHAHGLTIVCTYADRGASALRIKNRIGLTQLIDNVSTGKADFGSILVYDVRHQLFGCFHGRDIASGIVPAFCTRRVASSR
jgi:DNA invertase Pin-like site-specific DNA recombinase